MLTRFTDAYTGDAYIGGGGLRGGLSEFEFELELETSAMDRFEIYMPSHVTFIVILLATFQMHFLVWQLVYFDANFTKICFSGCNGQKTSISSDNGVVLNRRHPINGINDELVCWRMCCHLASTNGALASYLKLRVAHAPGMPGTFSPPPLVSDPDLHHGTCVTHVP